MDCIHEKINKIYANNWPIALYPYYKENMHKYFENKNYPFDHFFYSQTGLFLLLSCT